MLLRARRQTSGSPFREDVPPGAGPAHVCHRSPAFHLGRSSRRGWHPAESGSRLPLPCLVRGQRLPVPAGRRVAGRRSIQARQSIACGDSPPAAFRSVVALSSMKAVRIGPPPRGLGFRPHALDREKQRSHSLSPPTPGARSPRPSGPRRTDPAQQRRPRRETLNSGGARIAAAVWCSVRFGGLTSRQVELPRYPESIADPSEFGTEPVVVRRHHHRPVR
jgi:hypothetical protein